MIGAEPNKDTNSYETSTRLNDVGLRGGIESQKVLEISRREKERSFMDEVNDLVPKVDGYPIVVLGAKIKVQAGDSFGYGKITLSGGKTEVSLKYKSIEIKIRESGADGWKTDAGIKVSVPLPGPQSGLLSNSAFMKIETSGKFKIGYEVAPGGPLKKLGSSQLFGFKEGNVVGVGNETRILNTTVSAEGSVGLGLGSAAMYGRLETAVVNWMSDSYHTDPVLR